MRGGDVDAAPAACAGDPELDDRGGRSPRQPRQVLPRLERPDREDVVAVCGRGPSGVNTDRDVALYATSIRSAGTRASSITSRFVNSETAITRVAALSTGRSSVRA